MRLDELAEQLWWSMEERLMRLACATLTWQDLFFLINAPAIQQMAADARKVLPKPEGDSNLSDFYAAQLEDNDNFSGQEWWMQNLFDMKTREPGNAGDDDEDISNHWWMQNLYSMNSHQV